VAIQPNKPSSRVFLIIGVALAALAFAGVLFALNQSKGGNDVSVVVAKSDIAAGTPLTKDLVTVASVPSTTTPADAYTSADAVVGKIPAASVKANTVLVPALFPQAGITASAATGAAGSPVISVETQLTKGYVAMAIPAVGTAPVIDDPNCPKPPKFSVTGLGADQVSAGFYILPGDHIDILVDDGTGGVRYSFQDLPVLRTGAVGSAAGGASLYLVEVARNQAQLLADLVTNRYATSCSEAAPFLLKYVLRPQSEWGKLAADGSGYTPNYLDNTKGPAFKAGTDSAVNAGALAQLFGH